MTLAEEIQSLRSRLAMLASESDDALTARYQLAGSTLPRTPYWQGRRLISFLLRKLHRARFGPQSAWPARLKHVDGSAHAKPLLIWAMDAERSTLRNACLGLAEVLKEAPDLAPVLITNVAEFAFYCRLGWLIEFVPALEGEGEDYETGKSMLIARLYRDAPILPVEAGLSVPGDSADILQAIQSQQTR